MSPQRWSANGYPSLLIESWDEGYTVFQTSSGQTHFLNEAGIGILSRLNGSSATTAEICAGLFDRQQLSQGPHLRRQIEDLLARFDALGLVERVT